MNNAIICSKECMFKHLLSFSMLNANHIGSINKCSCLRDVQISGKRRKRYPVTKKIGFFFASQLLKASEMMSIPNFTWELLNLYYVKLYMNKNTVKQSIIMKPIFPQQLDV